MPKSYLHACLEYTTGNNGLNGLTLLAAVDASQFRPDPDKQPSSRVTIVMLSRLVYRKGIDLLAVTIPEMCHRYPHVDFLIGESLSPA